MRAYADASRDRRPSATGAARTLVCGLALLAGFAGSEAQAQNAVGDPPEDGQRAEIIVYGRALPQIGLALSGSQGVVGYRDFENRPLSRVGELVENVPGVIATQHSGTGKANQYFLRGFNLDHGTDFAGFVDGAPVNLRTHGHGQGYLDLNFLIPELVERIDYRKGPYFAEVGDFSAAGTVSFTTRRALRDTLIEATGGSYGYYRALAAGSTEVGDRDLLVALDGTRSNGPWERDEDLHKLNGLVKFSGGTDAGWWSLGLTLYHADWNATDQIPRRAVAGGWIGRFGTIDPYLGGRTTRIGLSLTGKGARTDWTAYAIFYDFRLTSNFTYFLEDPVNGDEFQQRDRRGVFGGQFRRRIDTELAGLPASLTLGAEARYDRIGTIGLYRSIRGIRSATIRQDRVDEYSASIFGQSDLVLTPRLRLMLSARGDLYGYAVASQLAANSGSGSDALFSPKAALAWRAMDRIELYANYGEGFHSNDVRGATIRVDPATGDPAERVGVLVKARGAEVGGRVELGKFTASLVGYYLALGSELVFVGDAGSTESNAASRRLGGEAALFWKPLPWLALDASGALTHARFHGVAPGEDRIPNAVRQVFAAGAAIGLRNGLSGSLRLRHFGAAPLVEDDGARSSPTTLVNLGGYCRFGRLRIGVDILNLFDARNADITFFYTSRLPGETARGVVDYHFHPVEPRQFRLSLRLSR